MMSDTHTSIAILRRAALIFVPLAMLALPLAYLLYSSQAAAIRAGAEAAERQMAETARHRLAQTLMAALSDTNYIANQDALLTWLERDGPEALRHLQNEHLAFSRSRALYDQIRLLDASGRETLRIDWRDDAPQVATPALSAETIAEPVFVEALALDRGQLLVTDFSDTGPGETAQPTICFAAPLFDPAGQKRGVAIVKYRAQPLFDRLQMLSGDTAKLWLVDDDGNWLIGRPMTELGGGSFAASYPAIWHQIDTGPAAATLHAPEGRFTIARITANDYRPLAAPQTTGVAPVAGPSWIAIAFTPQASVWDQAAEPRRYMIFATAALLVLLAAAAIGLARQQLQRRETEQQIRLSEARFRDLLESAPDGIIIADGAGCIELVNAQIERQFGYPRHELIGQSIDKLIPERMRAGHAAHRAAYLAAPRTRQMGVDMDLRGARKDGSEFPVAVSLSPTRTSKGLGVFCDIRDISAQHETDRRIQDLNRRLRQDNAELEALNRELEAFSYSVSHDLRAPLRAISGFSLALQEDVGSKLDAGGRAHLERVRQAAQRMEILIEDLLQLASVSRTEMNKCIVDVSGLASEILDELAASQPQRGAKAEVAPGLRVSADPRLLRIALENLLGNAWKFSQPADRPIIAVGQEMTASGLAFFVRDNGVGFDMSKAAGLFRPFQRLHEARQFPGSGIGLATTQRVIRRHGGKIWATSKPGEGAIFYFTLQ